MLFFGSLFFLLYREMPLYRQMRTGRGNVSFQVWKLRTLRDRCDENCVPLPAASRSTRLGSFMRSYSIDELPQLINILRGEMSLVGLRPQIAAYLPAMTEQERKRHDVLPGLTGYAQINGRNTAHEGHVTMPSLLEERLDSPENPALARSSRDSRREVA